MQNSSVLLLWLEGPMQSWGASSLFDRRASLDFPTRSGVLGLVFSALGAGGGQNELLARLAAFPQSVTAYAKSASCEFPLLQLCDYHMVGNGYDDKDPWQKLHIPKKSDGSAAVGGGSKRTYRYYIQDAAFAVYLHVPDDLAQEWSCALQTPHWDISLGRRCCVPTEFVFQGCFATEQEARQQGMSLAASKSRIAAFEVYEGARDAGEALVISDVPVQFGSKKRYAERWVTIASAEKEASHA